MALTVTFPTVQVVRPLVPEEFPNTQVLALCVPIATMVLLAEPTIIGFAVLLASVQRKEHNYSSHSQCGSNDTVVFRFESMHMHAI